MQESIYDKWADIYDLVYSYVREDIPFYVEEALRSKGPVIELGCGTGRVAIPIAEAGVGITGLDFSEAMLEVARSKAGRLQGNDSLLTLARADMREFSLDEKFSLAIIPFRGFLSLLTVEDQVKTLLNIRRHLASDGRLILNFFVPDIDTLTQEGDVPYHLRDVTDPDTGARLVLWNQTSCDAHNQVLSTRIIIEILDHDGAVSKRIYRDLQLRYIYRWEMHHLLKICGYEVLDLYGDFDRSPFDETSGEMVWVAGLTG